MQLAMTLGDYLEYRSGNSGSVIYQNRKLLFPDTGSKIALQVVVYAEEKSYRIQIVRNTNTIASMFGTMSTCPTAITIF